MISLFLFWKFIIISINSTASITHTFCYSMQANSHDNAYNVGRVSRYIASLPVFPWASKKLGGNENGRITERAIEQNSFNLYILQCILLRKKYVFLFIS